jgi:hypothetical protein
MKSLSHVMTQEQIGEARSGSAIPWITIAARGHEQLKRDRQLI